MAMYETVDLTPQLPTRFVFSNRQVACGQKNKSVSLL